MSPDGEALNLCLNMILTTIRKNVTPVSVLHYFLWNLR